MTTKVVGSGFVGEKIVGNLDFFTVTVLDNADGGMPFGNTGVVATRAQLVEAGELSNATLSATNSITIVNPLGAFDDKAATSTTYTANAAYDAAYAAQKNLDLLVETISQKAQPILMSDIAVVDPYGTDSFLNAGVGAAEAVNTFRFAVEHTAVFADNTVASDSKAVTLEAQLDALGDALRAAISATPIEGYRTWDYTLATRNFLVAFEGTL